MGTKRDILETDIKEEEVLKNNIHSDRRTKDKNKKKAEEKRIKKGKKVPVWVKKEVLEYEEVSRELVQLLRQQKVDSPHVRFSTFSSDEMVYVYVTPIASFGALVPWSA